ncbi:hypothetical protein DVK02_08810 [Halobellus sp. Atlit-31R]|nr:hypothetical protein DVK02_08810 [Halobellus sp. Atlit-31R]
MTDDATAAGIRILLPDGATHEGPIVDFRDDSSAPTRDALRRAIRSGCPTVADAPAVYGPPPQSVHTHVGCLTAATSVTRRPALAAAAAARGIETPHDDALREARRTLRGSTPGDVDAAKLRTARRQAAEAGAERERLRERVATIRGRVNALRDTDADVRDADALDDAEASLSEATRRLSEVSTERVAATQRLRLLEDRARSARDARSARLRAEDRVGNLERAVRDARVATVEEEFAAARRAVSSRADWEHSGLTDAESTRELSDALAVARIAPLRAPVLVAPAVVDALGGSEPTRELLEAPIVVR